MEQFEAKSSTYFDERGFVWQKSKEHGLVVQYPSGAVWPSWRPVDRHGDPLSTKRVKEGAVLAPTDTVAVRTGMKDMTVVAVRGQGKKVGDLMAQARKFVKPQTRTRSVSWLGPYTGLKKISSEPYRLPDKCKTVEEVRLAVGVARAKEESRYALNAIFIDGKRIMATDGNRMFIAIGKKGEWGRNGLYGLTPKGGLEKHEGNFPPYKDVIPVKHSDMTVVQLTDIEKLVRQARQARIMTDDEHKGMGVHLNRNKTLGFASRCEQGSAEINFRPESKLLFGIRPDYFIDALEFAARMGDLMVEMRCEAPNRPVVIEGKRSLSVTMPYNLA